MDTSDYFSSMFSGRFSEVNATAIDLSNCMHEIDELNTVFDYLYSGNITLSEKNISYVLSLASLFLLAELKAACAEFLMANLVPSTAIPIFVLADQFFLQKVRAGCLEVIKAWFPFYICTLKEALDMSPDCLQVLLKEKVFGLLSNDVKKTFVDEWHKRFMKSSEKATGLPKEVSGLLKEVAALTQPRRSRRRRQPSGNEREEMLFTVVMPLGTYSRKGFDECSNMRGIEVLAFSPKRKAWKSVLCHTFSKEIYRSTRHPDKVRDLIGVNETTAFFRFEHKAGEPKDDWDGEESEDEDETYIVAVDLESNAESVINTQFEYLPRTCQNYFLWEGRLCACFSEDHDLWYLYFNDHGNECEGTCEGDCWEKICLLSKRSMHNSGTFVTKILGNDLYVGLDTTEYIKSAGDTTGTLASDRYCRRVHVFCISPSHEAGGKKCQVTELPSPGTHNYDGCPFPFEEKIDPKFYCISYPEASQLVFELQFEVASASQNFRKSMKFIYDVKKKVWRKNPSDPVAYPEAVPRVLGMSRKIRKYTYYGDLFSESDVYTDGYLARSSSPFNTSFWREEKGVWQLVTHAPRPVSSLAFIKRAECRVGFFETLPDASFVDWSQETGQSPIVTLTASKLETDFELQFEKGWLQSFTEWQRKWAEKQQGPGDPLSESESDYSDDSYMFYRHFEESSDDHRLYCCHHEGRCGYYDNEDDDDDDCEEDDEDCEEDGDDDEDCDDDDDNDVDCDEDGDDDDDGDSDDDDDCDKDSDDDGDNDKKDEGEDDDDDSDDDK